MPRFGQKSNERLFELHEDLRALCMDVIAVYDFGILCAHRTQAEQDEAYKSGNSKTPWPLSKHNKKPAEAVDIAPYIAELPPHLRLLIGNTQQLRDLAAHLKLSQGRALELLMAHYSELHGAFTYAAAMRGIKIRIGNNWDKDQSLFDNAGKLNDPPHIELA